MRTLKSNQVILEREIGVDQPSQQRLHVAHSDKGGGDLKVSHRGFSSYHSLRDISHITAQSAEA